MGLIVDSVRMQACYRIFKGFRPTYPVKDLIREIGFGSDEDSLAKGCLYLKDIGALFVSDASGIDAPTPTPTPSRIPKKGKGAVPPTAPAIGNVLELYVNTKDSIIKPPTAVEPNLL